MLPDVGLLAITFKRSGRRGGFTTVDQSGTMSRRCTRNVDFRCSTLLCVKETRAFTTSQSLVISVFLPFFPFMRQCDAVISRCEFGSAFPTRGIVCNDLWLRSVRTSQHHRYIHANSRPMFEANQDGTRRPSSAPTSWIEYMNIDQRSFIDLRGHQDALYIALIVVVRKSMASISSSDRQGKILI